MAQVQTNTTMEISDALEEIRNAPKAVQFSHDDNTIYVRDATNPDHRFDFLMNIFIDVIGERRVITVEDEETVRSAIEEAETAEVVRIMNTPWSGAYNPETEEET